MGTVAAVFDRLLVLKQPDLVRLSLPADLEERIKTIEISQSTREVGGVATFCQVRLVRLV